MAEVMTPRSFQPEAEQKIGQIGNHKERSIGIVTIGRPRLRSRGRRTLPHCFLREPCDDGGEPTK